MPDMVAYTDPESDTMQKILQLLSLQASFSQPYEGIGSMQRQVLQDQLSLNLCLKTMPDKWKLVCMKRQAGVFLKLVSF